MSIASLILGVILSTLYGSLFHLWRGGGIGRLFFSLCLSWIGFLIGHLCGVLMNIQFDKIGELHAGLASVTSISFLAIGYWLSQNEKPHHDHT